MTIYDQALKATNDGRVTDSLYKSETESIFLRRSNGNALLVYQKLDARGLVQKCEQVRCATYMPNRGGFIFTLDRDTYARWVAKTGHKIKKTFEERTIEWRNSQAGQAYMDLPPSKEVLAELRRHKMI